MTVRPFDWRDIPTLHRWRNQSVFLDTALVLTRGALLVPGVLFSYMAPSLGVFTYVFSAAEDNPLPVMGQFMHPSGAQFAHLTFLAPDQVLEQLTVQALMDHMAALSGERGAMRLLADVDEVAPAFEALRRSGFGIYTRQRIWQIGPAAKGAKREASNGSKPASGWRAATTQDAFAIRVLYNNVVPGIVQQVEPFITQKPRGLVFYNGLDLMAYVEIKYGHRGIWVQPFIHPDAQDIAERIQALIRKIPNRLSLPVYICVRSYQSWLEVSIEALGAEARSRQAVMVKHLTAPQKAERAYAMPLLESGHPDASVPLARIERQ
jgi:hypothetical protein